MPKRGDIHKVLVIGSGPIIIGQAAEFDYAGTQACRALREEGLEVVLVNSNPATIMTDLSVADVVYLEPLTVSFLSYILGKERPDGVLATLGGQMGLNMASELGRTGVLTDLGIPLLGTPLSAIKLAEDREDFRNLMIRLGHPIARSRTVTTVEEGIVFAQEIGYPVVLRPAYTLGGTGGGFAHDDQELLQRLPHALALSPITQVLVEESIAGYKEVEYEIVRDQVGNTLSICNMENIDPVGIHTGDSIVVAPSQTLSDYEYQMLRSAAIDIVNHLGVVGGCNVQFALHPDGRYRVIEVNPRVSRSSALASKATGYPIARIVTKIAIGLTLPEIANPVTVNTTAAFEPALDYVVVKIPRWPFDKFPTAERRLGTQMKATGEVMAIDRTFAGGLQKAVRSLDIKRSSLYSAELSNNTDEEIWIGIEHATDERLFFVTEGIRRGFGVGDIAQRTAIDPWFVEELAMVVQDEEWIAQHPSTWTERARELKQRGFSDERIAELTHSTTDEIRAARIKLGIVPAYKMVDTCAGEFPAQTPYYYATYEEENEALPLEGPKILVIGSGPIRIGQGIEFDAASVYALNALKRLGYKAIMVNNNPETVSTDFNASDRLYFEPITLEDVLNIIDREQPDGVVVQFGGQTAINLAASLAKNGVKIIGTELKGLQAAEDRELFDRVVEQLGIRRPPGLAVTTTHQAFEAADKIGFPLLVRPSYVLGGRAMKIVEDAAQLASYLQENNEMGMGQPLLMDRYMSGLELEVDVVSDGQRVLIPAVMEHVERAGVHSGDSLAVLPPVRAQQTIIDQVVDISTKLCLGLGIKGLLNIQFVAVEDQVYVIEANPRSSRTVPFVIKATGVPLVDLAMEASITGHFDERWGEGLLAPPDHFSVKMPVFSFAKLGQVDAILGPEMKSTGEVMGIDRDFSSALYKALIGGGFRLPAGGKILATIADADKEEALPYLRDLAELGYRLYATRGTLAFLSVHGIPATPVYKIRERRPHLVDLIHQGQFDLVIDTITVGGNQEREGFLIRRAAVERGSLCFTSLDTVRAAIEALKGRQRQTFSVHPLNEWLRVGQVR
ncbi:MAG: carbamoyl-phosphate synthase large subunit [Firmicutes bacterium]|jgi:carbamoyl-phosphate synthase large subunit|uniref:Carbamoyl phosphate synthase large chain n=1 Tax=Sulfobacillus benefaciens TaxID=453960 RepID=A0A2T2X6T7_9FIRM|nr:carbamoyl-phosphate synthase large subunit [Bacillota bacterium]MCL5013830.1 carbamoyl-phosphate synthase large subunit [Bacillota bacterium]PSR30213.1 MAG: carbamoyl-phosphate synthase large subunit [Sulfobacillus benefaciens]